MSSRLDRPSGSNSEYRVRDTYASQTLRRIPDCEAKFRYGVEQLDNWDDRKIGPIGVAERHYSPKKSFSDFRPPPPTDRIRKPDFRVRFGRRVTSELLQKIWDDLKKAAILVRNEKNTGNISPSLPEHFFF